MSMNASVRIVEPRRMPDEGAIRKQHGVTRRWFVLLVALMVLVAVALIAWVFFIASIDKATVAALAPAANLTLVLAPVLAAAAGVERTLETLFNIIENSWKSLVAYLGRGLRWLNSAQLEVSASRQWLAEVSARYNEELHSLKIKDGMSVSDLSNEMQDKISAATTMMKSGRETFDRCRKQSRKRDYIGWIPERQSRGFDCAWPDHRCDRGYTGSTANVRHAGGGQCARTCRCFHHRSGDRHRFIPGSLTGRHLAADQRDTGWGEGVSEPSRNAVHRPKDDGGEADFRAARCRAKGG